MRRELRELCARFFRSRSHRTAYPKSDCGDLDRRLEIQVEPRSPSRQIVALLDEMKRRSRALMVMIALKDDTGLWITQTRLARTITATTKELEQYDTATAVELEVSLLRRALRRGVALFETAVLKRVRDIDRERSRRWIDRIALIAQESDGQFASAGPDLFEVRHVEQLAPYVTYTGLHVEESIFGPGVRGMSFDRTKIMRSEFREADLDETTWIGAQLHDCNFLSSTMSRAGFYNAAFDRCSFFDANSPRHRVLSGSAVEILQQLAQ